MVEKYYTPEIEEFHIGFEYEYLNKYSSEKLDDWKPEIFKEFNDWFTHNFEIECSRVKYLDKEDIESLGFEHIGSLWFKADAPAEMGYWTEIKIRMWTDDVFYIHGYRGSESERLFQGKIKNKSELKRILKQLEI